MWARVCVEARRNLFYLWVSPSQFAYFYRWPNPYAILVATCGNSFPMGKGLLKATPGHSLNRNSFEASKAWHN